ncbi:hypothetical protein BJ878DRAFT_55044 [Calycina marina]|uniref:Uncharacterized protein n=1 Tax=Calycina marina TaxID=1763456 RepID=A0A9P7ZA23_9HELO|nr:hypothetical protein BJ878DRAFT_55044 [Calycina marina]
MSPDETADVGRKWSLRIFKMTTFLAMAMNHIIRQGIYQTVPLKMKKKIHASPPKIIRSFTASHNIGMSQEAPNDKQGADSGQPGFSSNLEPQSVIHEVEEGSRREAPAPTLFEHISNPLHQAGQILLGKKPSIKVELSEIAFDPVIQSSIDGSSKPVYASLDGNDSFVNREIPVMKPATKKKKAPSKSRFFSPTTSPAKVSNAPKSPRIPRITRATVSCISFPKLSAPEFGLIQERLTHQPFRLIIAVTFLIKTRGRDAIPVFFELMAFY